MRITKNYKFRQLLLVIAISLTLLFTAPSLTSAYVVGNGLVGNINSSGNLSLQWDECTEPGLLYYNVNYTASGMEDGGPYDSDTTTLTSFTFSTPVGSDIQVVHIGVIGMGESAPLCMYGDLYLGNPNYQVTTPPYTPTQVPIIDILDNQNGTIYVSWTNKELNVVDTWVKQWVEGDSSSYIAKVGNVTFGNFTPYKYDQLVHVQVINIFENGVTLPSETRYIVPTQDVVQQQPQAAQQTQPVPAPIIAKAEPNPEIINDADNLIIREDLADFSPESFPTSYSEDTVLADNNGNIIVFIAIASTIIIFIGGTAYFAWYRKYGIK